MKKNISILGSTGSIGKTTFKIIEKKKNFYSFYLLSANKNFNLISTQIKKYNPKIFVVNDFKTFNRIKKKFTNKSRKIKIYNNFNNIKLKKSDITISAIPGIKGLEPTIIMTKFSKKVLLANKESIICGWSLIKKTSLNYSTKLIPIDSEHFAISKLLENHKLNQVEKVYLTASGGPFLDFKAKQLEKVKPKDALNHPKWKMGKKISVDSATLMNKMLEIIEAQKLFNIPINKLEVLIHPNSLVHAVLELKNGLTKFIYHKTSMIVPLANAILDDNLNISEFHNFKKEKYFSDLLFQKVNSKIFPIIKIKKRLNEHPSTPIIINAANEILVDHFLRKNLPFLAINKIILTVLKDRNYINYAIRKPNNLNQIYTIDTWARKTTLKKIDLYDFKIT